MITTYSIPCTIGATNNDHLMIVELKITQKSAPLLITAIRAMLDAKLHIIQFSDAFRDLPIVAEAEEIHLDFGSHIKAQITPEHLESLEYFIIDRLLERVKPTASCNLTLSGTNSLLVDFTLKIIDN